MSTRSDGTPGRCVQCGFDPADWSAQDSTRTLTQAEELIAGWSAGADPVLTQVLDERTRATRGILHGTGDVLQRVHGLWHGLVSIADSRRAGGDMIATQHGSVTQLSRSGGGVPKRAVPSVTVDRRGVVGDVQATRLHHGRPWQALCLWSADVVDALVAEGHPIQAGAAGENITISGLDWSMLRGGSIMDIGSVQCQLSAPATPCSKNRRWFTDGDFSRIDDDRHPGWSRWYASVLEPGAIAAGDPVVLEGPRPHRCSGWSGP
jgi:MOSC domain-containing protein YiiM